jgi:hypothetical protein
MKSMGTQCFVDCDVAVKVPGNFGQNEVQNLFQEINAIKKIEYHNNVVSFLGWCMHREAPCLIFELAQQNLLTYVRGLRERTEEISQQTFLSILWQVAQGI